MQTNPFAKKNIWKQNHMQTKPFKKENHMQTKPYANKAF